MIRALALTGPTASGKTALSLKIAKALGCEIISLDSMQIYKYMDIGTAKATAEERAEIPHHMLDFLLPNEPFSAKAYKDMAMKCANEITMRGKTPLFVGGTGLYLSTLIRPECEEAPESNPSYREAIEAALKTEEDRVRLHERLKEIDPAAADAVHYNNVRRVIRALEIYDATGKTKTYFDELTKRKNEDIDIIHVTLDFHNRENLYERANLRVDEMIRLGLIDEVKSLIDRGYLESSSTASQAIGYKELREVIECGADLKEKIEDLKQATRNYAKRQLTWFRNMKNVNQVFTDGEDGVLKKQSDVLGECLAFFEAKN